ncbi:hypothetical protein ACHAXS_000756 [Conticribra weissflogii]
MYSFDISQVRPRRTNQARVNSPQDGNELLVDWPINRNNHGYSKEKIFKKKIRFSETSMLRLYPENFCYSKSYTKADRKIFGRRVLYDALKMRNALESTRDSSTISIARRLELCGIEVEELNGLENLVLEKSPSDLARLRKLQVKTVLMEQENQRMNCCIDNNRMAELSRSLSEKSAKMARVRAAIGA